MLFEKNAGEVVTQDEFEDIARLNIVKEAIFEKYGRHYDIGKALFDAYYLGYERVPTHKPFSLEFEAMPGPDGDQPLFVELTLEAQAKP